MSRKSVAPRTASPKPAIPRTVPLEAISITWTPIRRFEVNDKPTTITGRQLAIALQLLSTIHPAMDWDRLGEREEIALEAEGLSDIAHLLGLAQDEADGVLPRGLRAVFWSLARRMRELAAQADVVLHADNIVKSATVSITPEVAR